MFSCTARLLCRPNTNSVVTAENNCIIGIRTRMQQAGSCVVALGHAQRKTVRFSCASTVDLFPVSRSTKHNCKGTSVKSKAMFQLRLKCNVSKSKAHVNLESFYSQGTRTRLPVLLRSLSISYQRQLLSSSCETLNARVAHVRIHGDNTHCNCNACISEGCANASTSVQHASPVAHFAL